MRSELPSAVLVGQISEISQDNGQWPGQSSDQPPLQMGTKTGIVG